MPKAQQVEFLLAGVRDTNGDPVANGTVYSYIAGTTTAKALYSASDKSASYPQGQALDGYGRLQAWGDGAYKLVIKDSGGTTLYTFDNVVYGYDDGELKWGGTSGGTGNAQTVTISSVTALTSGLRVIFIAGNSNSGATTLNVSGLGAVAVKRLDGSTALSANDILAGDIVDVIYDTGAGGRFRMLNPAPNRTAFYGGTSGGSANAQTITVSPTISALSAGMFFDFFAGYNNTGGLTLNVNSIGAKNVYKDVVKALDADDIIAGSMYRVIYDGSSFYLIGRTDQTPFAKSGTNVTVTTTSGESSLLSFTVPAKTLGLNRALRVTVIGRFLNNTGANNGPTVRVKFGGVTQITDAVYAAKGTSANPYYCKMDIIIQNGNVTNAQRIQYYNKYETAAALGTATSADPTTNVQGYQDGAIDTTIDQTFEVSVQLSAASANLTYQMRSYISEII